MDKVSAIALFEKFYKNGYTENDQRLFAMLYVSLISSDTCINEEQCIESLHILDNLKDGLKESNVPEEFKEQFKEKIEMGILIVERDLEDFIKNDSFGNC